MDTDSSSSPYLGLNVNELALNVGRIQGHKKKFMKVWKQHRMENTFGVASKEVDWAIVTDTVMKGKTWALGLLRPMKVFIELSWTLKLSSSWHPLRLVSEGMP